MRILILGAGAVGTYVGGKLALGGNQVFFYQRNPDICRRINDEGVVLHENGKRRAAKAAASSSPDQLFSYVEKFDAAIFCVKGFSTLPVLDAVSPWLTHVDFWVTLQNGLGNEEAILTRIAPDRLTAGSLTTACSIWHTGEVAAENRGGVALASVKSGRPSSKIIECFELSKFETSVCPDWRAMKWSKLLLNILGNITGALLDWPSEKLFSNPIAFDLERSAFLEAVAVMEKKGIMPIDLPHQPVTRYIWGIKRLPAFLLRLIFKQKMRRGRGTKPPSLHLDLLNGKTETELPFLYGKLIEAGKEVGVKTPTLQTLAETYDAIVRKTLPWESVKGNPEFLLNYNQLK